MKAFIGHSFDEKDETLVDKIISFLSQREIQCESGLKAQNKSVSEKVKQRIDRNDIFIGIFTVDKPIECVRSLADRIMRRTVLPDFTTSNWVIQESGYAIGKGKSTIFLVEKGVYKFPELQGDAELILFARDKAGLNDALLKLLDILKTGKTVVGEPQTATTQSGDTKKENSDKDIEKQDKLPWNELFDAHDAGKIVDARKIYDEKIRSKLNEKMTKLWDIVLLRWEYCSGDASVLTRLEEVAEKEQSFTVFWQIGICHEFTNKYNEARQNFTKCLQLAGTDLEKVDATIRIAECYSANKEYPLAINTLLDALNNKGFQKHYGKIYKALVEIAQEKEDGYLFTMFSEKTLDINPVDTKLRFNLAYKYGNIDKPDLATYHYKNLLKIEDDSMGLNNIAVEYDNLSIKTKSISYFEKAVENKNPLAHANLANRYIEQGFAEAADALLKKADELSKDGKDVHQNVGYSKNKLRLLREEDEKKEKEIMALAEQKQKFRVKHAEAYCLKHQELQNELADIWMIKNAWNIKFTFDKGKNTFVGQDLIEKEESIPSGLGILLSAPYGLGTPEASKIKICKIRKIRIEGVLYNFSGNYSLTITEEKKGVASYEKPEEVYSANGLLIINGDFKRIDVMEEDSKKQCYFEKWDKQ